MMSRTYSLEESDEILSLVAPVPQCVQGDGPDLPGRGDRRGLKVRVKLASCLILDGINVV